MCLSTAYRNRKSPENILMQKVMALECREGVVLLTDLMERTYAVEGTLERADLVEGFVIIREAKSE